MSRGTAKALSIISICVLIALSVLSIAYDNETFILIVLICYLPFGIYLNYCQRCRHCGRWPRKGDFWSKYCAGCGKKLDD